MYGRAYLFGLGGLIVGPVVFLSFGVGSERFFLFFFELPLLLLQLFFTFFLLLVEFSSAFVCFVVISCQNHSFSGVGAKKKGGIETTPPRKLCVYRLDLL